MLSKVGSSTIFRVFGMTQPHSKLHSKYGSSTILLEYYNQLHLHLQLQLLQSHDICTLINCTFTYSFNCFSHMIYALWSTAPSPTASTASVTWYMHFDQLHLHLQLQLLQSHDICAVINCTFTYSFNCFSHMIYALWSTAPSPTASTASVTWYMRCDQLHLHLQLQLLQSHDICVVINCTFTYSFNCFSHMIYALWSTAPSPTASTASVIWYMYCTKVLQNFWITLEFRNYFYWLFLLQECNKQYSFSFQFIQPKCRRTFWDGVISWNSNIRMSVW